MESFYHSVNEWFASVIQTAPPQLRSGFFLSHLSFYDVQNSLLEDTLTAIALAMLVAVIVVFASTLNVGLTLAAVFTICGVIFVSMAILVFMGWKLNVLESVAITLAIGLSVDFTLHYAIMYQKSKGNIQECVSKISAPVSMAAFTTLIPGICMLPTRVLAYVQIGSFIIVLMCTSWFLATFFFQAFLHILGPTAFNAASIPPDTCCGRRRRIKKKETWHAKNLENPEQTPVRNGASTTDMKTFISVESTITHISNDNVVTTVAAQVNPPSSADVLKSSVSVNEDVFKSSNLNEEDLQDGRVTLPMTKYQQKPYKSPSPPPPPLESPSPPPLFNDNLPSAPSLETIEKKIETAIIHTDSPTIRADPVSSKRPLMDSSHPKKKTRRSGSSGTVVEFLPMQMETIEIDLTSPVPKQVTSTVVTSSNLPVSEPVTNATSYAHTQIIQPAIRSIIKTKRTMGNHGQGNAYHGYFYVEEHPPPPPPHAYELESYHHQMQRQHIQQQHIQQQQQQLIQQQQRELMLQQQYNIYAEPPLALTCDQSENNLRNYEMVPYVEPQEEVVMESVAASRRRRKSKTKSSLPPLETDLQQPLATEEEVISQVMSKARQNRSKSCHERSDSLKKYTKRKLAPDEDLITVVTDDHPTGNALCPPKPKPRKSLSRSGRSGSASLGNILAINPDEFLFTDNGDIYLDKIDARQTLPRSRRVPESITEPEIYYVQDPPKPTPRSTKNSSEYRHPLSLSTETILFNDDKYDPNPIVPNRAPDVPDIWLPMRSSVKA